LLPVLLLWAARPAVAQTSGRIQGTVLDPQGAAVPGVTVEATGSSMPGSRQSVTDTSGEFRLQALPPGVYIVKATIAGFKTAERRNVEINIDRTVTLNFNLEVATVAESVQ